MVKLPVFISFLTIKEGKVDTIQSLKKMQRKQIGAILVYDGTEEM